jgi:type II secretory pathway component GspD/PulD (secretin)
MNVNRDGMGGTATKIWPALMGLALVFSSGARGVRAQMEEPKPAQQKLVELQASQRNNSASNRVYETLYLANLTQTNELNDAQTDLRNMLPNAKIYGIPSERAISLWASPEDIALAKKILADLDKSRKVYRLTYTITDVDNGKRTGSQRFALVAVSGEKTEFKQGSRVPIVTGSMGDGNTIQSAVQYLDVGLRIEATLDGSASGERLRTKVEQSALADEKSGVGAQDPVVRQTELEGSATLAEGKSLALGSIDIPGTTRHQEIEVVAELVK